MLGKACPGDHVVVAAGRGPRRRLRLESAVEVACVEKKKVFRCLL